MIGNYDYKVAANCMEDAKYHFSTALVHELRANENTGQIKRNWLRAANLWLESAIECEKRAEACLNR